MTTDQLFISHRLAIKATNEAAAAVDQARDLLDTLRDALRKAEAHESATWRLYLAARKVEIEGALQSCQPDDACEQPIHDLTPVSCGDDGERW